MTGKLTAFAHDRRYARLPYRGRDSVLWNDTSGAGSEGTATLAEIYVARSQFDDELRGFEGIIGTSPALLAVLDLIRIVAPTDSTVLIEGETGTGKELIACAIHTYSRRRPRPFIKLNCAAIPLGLLEIELFGHEKGAFTGAVARKIGRFEAADGGTLFLDEIGDIPVELQAKLLRVLQEGKFERLGSTQTIRVNVRLRAATNGDLFKLVSERLFRGDLYYRLNVFPLPVPPLRRRAEDIPLLVTHFVAKYSARMQKQVDRIPKEVKDALVLHSWPGNIRGLQNFIERSVILTRGNTLCSPLDTLRPRPQTDAPQNPITLEETERNLICSLLRSGPGKHRPGCSSICADSSTDGWCRRVSVSRSFTVAGVRHRWYDCGCPRPLYAGRTTKPIY